MLVTKVSGCHKFCVLVTIFVTALSKGVGGSKKGKGGTVPKIIVHKIFFSFSILTCVSVGICQEWSRNQELGFQGQKQGLQPPSRRRGQTS